MIDSKHYPSPEYRFFLHDPEGDGMRYYRTAEERNADAEDAIQGYLDDCWSEGVAQVVAGEITHHAVAKNVELRPEREDFESDEAHEHALSDLGFSGNDWDYVCNYELAPISDPGEPI
ncbi:hypothetical protein [Alcaligenes aquatilis]|uniref:Uncharacterized protein n=1 Tax=Alcaligenes aquatilis TaxID=323284 RepID=A0A3G2HX52_9BURK|nr:hypothetical protein [Alcaligenes aquatilis]AYN21627.1 hypothetical protein D3M96_14455 [Alcaligenes aquatilis]